eukprot:365299-Chlamydomonas_euryale.AAC.4
MSVMTLLGRKGESKWKGGREIYRGRAGLGGEGEEGGQEEGREGPGREGEEGSQEEGRERKGGEGGNGISEVSRGFLAGPFGRPLWQASLAAPASSVMTDTTSWTSQQCPALRQHARTRMPPHSTPEHTAPDRAGVILQHPLITCLLAVKV